MCFDIIMPLFMAAITPSSIRRFKIKTYNLLLSLTMLYYIAVKALFESLCDRTACDRKK